MGAFRNYVLIISISKTFSRQTEPVFPVPVKFAGDYFGMQVTQDSDSQ